MILSLGPRHQALNLFFPRDLLGFLPQPFEIVKLPGLLLEHMPDHISRIKNDPIGMAHAPFGVECHSRFLELFFNVIGNGADLAVGSTGADDKIIAKIDLLTHI